MNLSIIGTAFQMSPSIINVQISKKEKCKARLILKSGKFNPTGIQTCKKSEETKMRDDECEINEYLVDASKDLSKYPNKIYQELIRFLNEKYKAKAIKIP
ncbi:hypothetical protein HZS_5215 [Henneguya salminicola]|nr:hypothetical protein HZS_5215 [Henneguya salminicola]